MVCCTSNGASDIYTARKVHNTCVSCGLIPNRGVHQHTYLCADCFIQYLEKQVQIKGLRVAWVPCRCDGAVALVREAKQEKNELVAREMPAGFAMMSSSSAAPAPCSIVPSRVHTGTMTPRMTCPAETAVLVSQSRPTIWLPNHGS
jgi:hypothetical protein